MLGCVQHGHFIVFDHWIGEDFGGYPLKAFAHALWIFTWRKFDFEELALSHVDDIGMPVPLERIGDRSSLRVQDGFLRSDVDDGLQVPLYLAARCSTGLYRRWVGRGQRTRDHRCEHCAWLVAQTRDGEDLPVHSTTQSAARKGRWRDQPARGTLLERSSLYVRVRNWLLRANKSCCSAERDYLPAMIAPDIIRLDSLSESRAIFHQS